jgi:hypothetical protein
VLLLLRVQALTLTAVRKDDKADLSLRSVYNYGNYGFTAIFNTSDKVNVTATIDKVRSTSSSSCAPRPHPACRGQNEQQQPYL